MYSPKKKYHTPPGFPIDLFESALTYTPENGDLFIASYPKCGTTWIQQIVYLLHNNGDPPEKTILFHNDIPFLEFTGADDAAKLPKPRILKTHLPFDLIPFSDDAKYIYTIRNPKDCCVSFWYHERDFPLLNCKNFGDFFELFMSGETGYGDYFDHILGWYSNKEKTNILVVHYEDLKCNFNNVLNLIAQFIDPKLLEKLNSDTTFREKVIKHSTFEFMKKTTNQQMKQFFDMPVDVLQNHDHVPQGFKRAFTSIKTNDTVDMANDVNFIRRGIIGDWKRHFNHEKNQRLDEQIIKSLSGKYDSLLNKWKRINLFNS